MTATGRHDPFYLRNLGAGKAVANQGGRVVTDNGSILVYDGERGYGQIVARNATLLGIERAKRDGGRGRRSEECPPYRPGRHLWRRCAPRRASCRAFRQHH